MGSKPFSLSKLDWAKIGKGSLLAAFGGFAVYITGTVLPYLQAHEQNDYDKLIYSVVAAAAPIVANLIRKYLGDTTEGK